MQRVGTEQTPRLGAVLGSRVQWTRAALPVAGEDRQAGSLNNWPRRLRKFSVHGEQAAVQAEGNSDYYFIREVTAGFSAEVTCEQKPVAKQQLAMHNDNNNGKTSRGSSLP